MNNIRNTLTTITLAVCVALFAAGCSPEYYYEKGEELSKNGEYNKAFEYYQKAAEKGYAQAQFYLGLCYHNGDGVEKNLSEAVIWFRKAADQGFAKAQYDLGICISTAMV